MMVIPVMTKLNFQSSVSHDPSKIILICQFGAQEPFLIIIMLKTDALINIYVDTVIHLFPEFFK